MFGLQALFSVVAVTVVTFFGRRFPQAAVEHFRGWTTISYIPPPSPPPKPYSPNADDWTFMFDQMTIFNGSILPPPPSPLFTTLYVTKEALAVPELERDTSKPYEMPAWMYLLLRSLFETILIGYHHFISLSCIACAKRVAEEQDRKAIDKATELTGELVANNLSLTLELKYFKDANLELLQKQRNIYTKCWDEHQEWRQKKKAEIRDEFENDFYRFERELQKAHDQKTVDLKEKYKKNNTDLKDSYEKKRTEYQRHLEHHWRTACQSVEIELARMTAADAEKKQSLRYYRDAILEHNKKHTEIVTTQEEKLGRARTALEQLRVQESVSNKEIAKLREQQTVSDKEIGKLRGELESQRAVEKMKGGKASAKVAKLKEEVYSLNAMIITLNQEKVVMTKNLEGRNVLESKFNALEEEKTNWAKEMEEANECAQEVNDVELAETHGEISNLKSTVEARDCLIAELLAKLEISSSASDVQPGSDVPETVISPPTPDLPKAETLQSEDEKPQTAPSASNVQPVEDVPDIIVSSPSEDLPKAGTGTIKEEKLKTSPSAPDVQPVQPIMEIVSHPPTEDVPSEDIPEIVSPPLTEGIPKAETAQTEKAEMITPRVISLVQDAAIEDDIPLPTDTEVEQAVELPQEVFQASQDHVMEDLAISTDEIMEIFSPAASMEKNDDMEVFSPIQDVEEAKEMERFSPVPETKPDEDMEDGEGDWEDVLPVMEMAGLGLGPEQAGLQLAWEAPTEKHDTEMRSDPLKQAPAWAHSPFASRGSLLASRVAAPQPPPQRSTPAYTVLTGSRASTPPYIPPLRPIPRSLVPLLKHISAAPPYVPSPPSTYISAAPPYVPPPPSPTFGFVMGSRASAPLYSPITLPIPSTLAPPQNPPIRPSPTTHPTPYNPIFNPTPTTLGAPFILPGLFTGHRTVSQAVQHPPAPPSPESSALSSPISSVPASPPPFIPPPGQRPLASMRPRRSQPATESGIVAPQATGVTAKAAQSVKVAQVASTTSPETTESATTAQAAPTEVLPSAPPTTPPAQPSAESSPLSSAPESPTPPPGLRPELRPKRPLRASRITSQTPPPPPPPMSPPPIETSPPHSSASSSSGLYSPMPSPTIRDILPVRPRRTLPAGESAPQPSGIFSGILNPAGSSSAEAEEEVELRDPWLAYD